MRGGRALRAGSPLRLSLQSFILRSKKRKRKKGEKKGRTTPQTEHSHHSHLQPSCVYYFKNNLFNRNSCVSGPLLRILGSRPLSIIISIIKMISRPVRGCFFLLRVSGFLSSKKGHWGARAGAGGAAAGPLHRRREGRALWPRPGAVRAGEPRPEGPTEGAHWALRSVAPARSCPAYNGLEAE